MTEPAAGKVEQLTQRREPPLPIFPFALGIVWALVGILFIVVIASGARERAEQESARG